MSASAKEGGGGVRISQFSTRQVKVGSWKNCMKWLVKLKSLNSLQLYPNKRRYHDDALKWGQNNPAVAQQCLNVPPLPSLSSSSSSSSSPETPAVDGKKLVDLPDYWGRRQWNFAVRQDELSHAHSLASHVLSAPLTCAAQLHPLLMTTASTKQHWACIGARAEADLPLEYWKELLIVRSWMTRETTAPAAIHIDFIGPEVVSRPPVIVSFQDSSLRFRWRVGAFHNVVSDSDTNFDACILLNPGLGHDHLKEQWTPTLDLLMEKRATTGTTLLLTAHSKLDADRDHERLSLYQSGVPAYTRNPFVSRITYQDPFNKSHIVRPNDYVTVIQD
jgi:hypothetical protein